PCGFYCGGVAGRSVTRTPTASYIAFVIGGMVGTIAGSPTPLSPRGGGVGGLDTDCIYARHVPRRWQKKIDKTACARTPPFFACSSPSQVSIALPGNPFCRKGEASRRHFLLGGVHLRFHNHLDSILDSVLGVSDCRWKVVEWKRVGMNLRRVEPFLSHERLGP